MTPSNPSVTFFYEATRNVEGEKLVSMGDSLKTSRTFNPQTGFYEVTTSLNMRPETVLELSRRKSRKDIVDLLITAGAEERASVKKQSPIFGHTKLLVSAAQDGDLDMVAHLLEGEVDPSETSEAALADALWWASLKKHIEIVRLLLSSGASVKGLAPNPLEAALKGSRREDTALVSLLLASGADATSPNSIGRTPLHYASHSSVIEALLEYVSDEIMRSTTFLPGVSALLWSSIINAQDHDGNTPLHMAVDGWTNAEKVEALLLRGAAVNLRNNEGRTALAIARAKSKGYEKHPGVKKTIRILREYGGTE